jgi:hypothetical protein
MQKVESRTVASSPGGGGLPRKSPRPAVDRCATSTQLVEPKSQELGGGGRLHAGCERTSLVVGGEGHPSRPAAAPGVPDFLASADAPKPD